MGFWNSCIFLGLLICETYSVYLTDCECGVTNSIQDRIVGGQITDVNDFPWLVYITELSRLFCGGSLINDRYVLTAGHCVVWSDKSELMVILGRHDITSKTGMAVKVKNIKVHEDFTSDSFHDTNDIALIKLAKSVNFNKHIIPICLPNPISEYTHLTASIAGWGKTSDAGKTNRFLKKASVKIIDDNACRKTKIGEHFADSMMCAYSRSMDACQGDSGGPLMYTKNNGRTEVIGIVSWGIGCAKPNIPGVYTKVVNFLKWIEQNTLDGVYCKNT